MSRRPTLISSFLPNSPNVICKQYQTHYQNCFLLEQICALVLNPLVVNIPSSITQEVTFLPSAYVECCGQSVSFQFKVTISLYVHTSFIASVYLSIIHPFNLSSIHCYSASVYQIVCTRTLRNTFFPPTYIRDAISRTKPIWRDQW